MLKILKATAMITAGLLLSVSGYSGGNCNRSDIGYLNSNAAELFNRFGYLFNGPTIGCSLIKGKGSIQCIFKNDSYVLGFAPAPNTDFEYFTLRQKEKDGNRFSDVKQPFTYTSSTSGDDRSSKRTCNITFYCDHKDSNNWKKVVIKNGKNICKANYHCCMSTPSKQK